MGSGEELVAFLAARYDEIEAAAKAATPGPWRVDNATYAEAIHAEEGTSVVAGGRWGDEASVFASTEDAVHIALNDPAYARADIAAKRLILAEHQPLLSRRGTVECSTCVDTPNEYQEEWTRYVWPCATVAALAAPFSGHPEFQETWRLT